MTRMTAKEFREQKTPKKNKYNAKKVVAGGHTFDSKDEYKRWRFLMGQLKAREIADLQVHPEYEITVNDLIITRYTPDFSYLQFYTPEHDGDTGYTYLIVEDVKSPVTKGGRFPMVKKLMKAVHGIDVKVVMNDNITLMHDENSVKEQSGNMDAQTPIPLTDKNLIKEAQNG